MKLMISSSFLNGYIRATDLIGTKEWPNIYDGMMKDYSAIRRDWESVGNSIARECREYAETRN